MPVARDGPGPRHSVSRRPYRPAKSKPRSAPAPNFPKAVPKRPGAVTVPRVVVVKPATPVRSKAWLARKAQRDLHRQAGAVRRAAKVQKTLGPAMAVRGGKRLTSRDIERVRRSPVALALLQERAYGSQAESVRRTAARQEKPRTTATVGEGPTKTKVPAILLERDPRKLKAAGFAPPGLADAIIGMPTRAIGNAPKDFQELVVTTPTSLAHLAKTAVTHPERVPGMLIDPYVEAVKHPVEAITEHPVSTALMFAPAAKVPLRTAGRAARLTGKQTLVREQATLPGTTLKEVRVNPREALPTARELARRGVRKRRGTGGQRITGQDLRRRVDEFYDFGQQHKQAAVAEAIRDERRKVKRLPKAERREKIEERASGARGGAHQHVEREFAREFGSHWQVGPGGAIVKPKSAPERGGVIHATREDAKRVAAAIERAGHFEPQILELEGATPGETAGFAVVPKAAAQRLGKHKRVGSGGFAGGPILRVTGRQFRKTVLPFSAKWLTGQAVEAGIRAAAQGAGPTSLIRYRRLLAELERVDPQAAKALRKRAVTGGQFGGTGAVGAELVSDVGRQGKTLADEFADSGLEAVGQALTKAGAKPGVRHLRAGYRGWTNLVFNEVNGRIEHLAKSAMLGKAVKQGPLMERRIIGLGEKAIAEAAHGLRGTSNQVQLARAVDRAYGRYSKFSPSGRDYILHTTPFFPWFRNMADFLLRVMPEDHPVKTSLIASLNVATEEYRKRERLSTRAAHVPGFMLGSTPAGKDKFVQVGRFGPFAPGEYASAIGGQAVPQFSSALLNLAGVDWTGQPIKGPKGEDASQERLAANAALTLGETLIPGAGQLDRITGLGAHYVGGKTKKPSVVQGKPIDQAILDMVNPVHPVGIKSEKGGKRRHVSKHRELLPLGGGGGRKLPLGGGRREKLPL